MNTVRLYAALFLSLILWASSFPGIKAGLEWFIASGRGGSLSTNVGTVVLLGAALCWSLFFIVQGVS